MKNRNWFWGIFFILATIVLIASQFGTFGTVGFWPLLGTILLIALMVSFIMHRGAWGIFIPLALIYMIWQKPLGLFYLSPWILIIAGILLTIGFGLLFSRKPSHHGNGDCHGGYRPESKISEDTNNENRPSINVSFGGITRYLHADALEYANFACSFGSLEVYFDDVTVSPNGAEVVLDCSFGSIKLYIPRNWEVTDQTSSSMGGLSFAGATRREEGSPRITLSGKISMGGVEVHYI